MTRKTVSIAIPKKTAAPPAPALKAESHADNWVRQEAPVAPDEAPAPAPASRENPHTSHLHVAIPREPSLFDAAKVSFIVPQLVYLQWSLHAWERSLKLFKR